MAKTEVIMSSKRYPDEFKIEATRQGVDCGHAVADVAGRPGIATQSVYLYQNAVTMPLR